MRRGYGRRTSGYGRSRRVYRATRGSYRMRRRSTRRRTARRAQTIRVVIQTVAASPVALGQKSVQRVRRMF